MKTFIKTFVVSTFAFAFAFTAYGASTPWSYSAIFDGETEAFGTPNETIDVEIFVEIPAGEVVHAISTDVKGAGDNRPFECHDVSNLQGESNRTYRVTHKLPANTGDYDFEVRAYTADTMSEANAKRGDTACTGDYDVLYDESDVVRVLPNSNGGTGTGSSSSSDQFAEFWEAINALTSVVSSLSAQVEDLTTQQCPPMGVPTIQLQNWLVAEGFMTQAEMNTGPGIYGPRTTRAYNEAKWACSN